MASAQDAPQPVDERTILGHPRALYVLFFAELWERFCYYGMRALLALHIAKEFYSDLQPEVAQEAASKSYGGFTALIYAMAIFGGAIADRVLGYRRSIMMGGLLMAGGEFVLVSGDKSTFFFGLALLIVGNGLFKPNISTLVGKLYKQGDPRRDGGFTIFYMGINIGATLAPLACEWVSSAMGSYRYGFMLAGAGMLLGVACFGFGTRLLGTSGLPPPDRRGIGPIVQVILGAAIVAPGIYYLLSMDEDVLGSALGISFALILCLLFAMCMKEERQARQRMSVLLLMLILNVVFWMGFEQAGNSLNFFAKKQLVPLQIGTWTMPAEWWQSVNAIFIVMLGPVFAALWVKLDAFGRQPSIPRKFGFGLLGMGLGFVVLNLGIGGATNDGKVLWTFLMGLYFVHTCAELCLSPVGLSMVTKLAPERMTGMVMGSWFISIATGNFLAGKISTSAAKAASQATDALSKVHAYGAVFTNMVYVGVGLGLVVILVSPLINKWMHGAK